MKPTKTKECPPNKILNPTTNRCILKTGLTAKKMVKKTCPSNKILNPTTNRCILKTGLTAKKILKSNIKYPQWENNSCYVDSLFIALFNNKNKFIKKELLEAHINDYNNPKLKEVGELIRKELINIYNLNSFLISRLRKLLDIYYDILKKTTPKLNILGKHDNWTTSQNDVFQLLEFIITIFKIKNSTKIHEGNTMPYFTNFINMIPIDLFMDNSKILKISDIYPSYNTTYNLDESNAYIDKHGIKQYSFTKKTEILKAPFLMIRISRNLGSYKLDTNVIPTKTLKLKENNFILHLNSIIIHYGSNKSGHYITLIKNNENNKFIK